ncbi:MAG TPA: hypothetical protein VGJ95_16990 [Pseudonocardiaceae bacterium]
MSDDEGLAFVPDDPPDDPPDERPEDPSAEPDELDEPVVAGSFLPLELAPLRLSVR